MTADEDLIRLALTDVGVHLHPNDPLPGQLAAIAANQPAPLAAVLSWIYDRPSRQLYSAADFRAWLQHYAITTAAAIEIHLRPLK